MHKIRISLEEILLRLKNNLRELVEEHEAKADQLMEQLYDANKTRMSACRLEYHRTSNLAEAEWEIQKIHNRIKSHVPQRAFFLLEEEVEYWETRLSEFTEIERALHKLQKEIKNVSSYLAHYEMLTCNEQPGDKQTCWDNMGENFKQRIRFAEEALMDTAKAMVTFFAVRGQNRILYKDSIGPYTVDDYGHKIYYFDNGKKQCHITCDGSYVQYNEDDKYYFDKWGRYIIKDGERLYQCASCTSLYKLTDDELLKKVTKDCGHSEVPNRDCKMQLKDPSEIEILPMVDQVDIKQTLSQETVKYLWDSLGHILPNALFDVGEKQPLNPIYYLANRILYHKYRGNNLQQLKEKKTEARNFRAEVYRKRQERALAANKAWKAKQIKKRKPEESYNYETAATMAANEAHDQAQAQAYQQNEDYFF